MHRLLRLFGTSVGRKLVMAVTGILLIGFLLVHMLGNMAIYQGPKALNDYAAWLEGHPLIWVARLGLLAIFSAHVYTAISLAIENSRARPTPYHLKQAVAATLSSRYIVVSGLLIFAFLIYHLLHFTFGVVQPEDFGFRDSAGDQDVYAMVVLGFQNVWISASYVVAMLIVGFHLSHGASSVFQTLGINHESYNALIKLAARGLVLVLVLGNASIPILVLSGFIQLPH